MRIGIKLMVFTIDFPFGSPFKFLAMHPSTGTVSAKDTKCLELLEVM